MVQITKGASTKIDTRGLQDYDATMKAETRSTGAVALVAGGVAAAFALAACCAIPVLLAGAGLSAHWLMPVAAFADPHRQLLTTLAIVALAGGLFAVLPVLRTCAPGDLCSRPAFRATIGVAAVAGVVLLVLSQLYA